MLPRKIRLLMDAPDRTTVDEMTSELMHIRQHKDVIGRLLSFDKDCSIPVELDDELSALGVVSVCRTPLEYANAFVLHSECTAYEPDRFDWGLLAADYANYLAAVRKHYEDAHDFGGTQEWVVFVAHGKTVVRFVAHGLLSRLRTLYMDAVTWHIARDAGVKLPPGRVVFVVKAACYEGLRNGLQSELED